MRAGRKLKVAGAVNAGAERERHPRPRGAVDRLLQRAALVVRAAGAHAEMHGVDRDRGARPGDGALRGERLGRDGGAGGGKSEKTTTIDTHAQLSGVESRTVQVPGRAPCPGMARREGRKAVW